MTEEAQFTFSWRALKLLGRGLYSNPWSALSELAANGFDAGANRVYVYIDARAKARATVEVIDNGIGMSRSDINAYVQVGRNKREDGLADGADPRPKGRKGIGKLAALFLSSRFNISTMQEGSSTHWALDAREGHINDDEHPHLVSTETAESTPNDALWEGFTSGTRVTMLDVDLTGYGPSALSALNLRLANQFLIEDDSPQQIYLWVRNFNDSDDPNYQAVKKSIAFRNMTEAIFNFSSGTPIPPELAGEPHHLTIPAPNLPQGRYKHTFIRKPFELPTELGNEYEDLAERVNLEEQTYEGRDFELTGWIGIHSTIDISEAQINDDRFMRNRFYNPAHIRLYVRGKLASDSLLADLGLTGTYANYIEGELSFDLLDDDSLPDIATANRQSFDETDSRILLLKALVTPLVRRLMLNRNALAREIAKLSANEQQRRQVAGKKQFNEQLWKDLSRYKDLSEGDRNDLQVVISNKIQGDIRPKDTYRVFISHASSDALFASFIDDLLQSHGATDDEIFFTSRHGSTKFSTDAEALSDIIKRNITDDNTLVFYLTSKHFLNSQYCLFEGGAGWATRAVSEYLKLNVEYSTIPGWLKNGRGEVSILSSDGTIELTETLHNYLVDGILNPMVEHLNRGRVISGDAPISPFERADVPSKVILARERKSPSDYYDSDVAEHWEHGIHPDKDEYLKQYNTP